MRGCLPTAEEVPVRGTRNKVRRQHIEKGRGVAGGIDMAEERAWETSGAAEEKRPSILRLLVPGNMEYKHKLLSE